VRTALRHVILAVTVLLGFGVTDGALAVTTNGSDVSSRYADCAYHQHAALLRALVLQLPSSNAIWQKAVNRIGMGCMDGALRGIYGRGISFNRDGAAVAFAEALVRGDYAQAGHFDLRSAKAPKMVAPPLDPKFVSAKSTEAKAAREKHDRDETEAFLLNFATCVCRQDGDGVHTLVLTARNTSEESSAFSAISGAFRGCAEQGDFNIGSETLRGALALVFYRMVGAPAGAEIEPLTVLS
jgi:hypothetical protein